MSPKGLDRRTFLKSAGLMGLAGSLGAEAAAAAGFRLPPPGPQSGQYNLNAIYDRTGTLSAKWDLIMDRYGSDVEVCMGVADMDFKVAPCVTEALQERVSHEAWGYTMTPDWYFEALADYEQRRYGLTVDPASIRLTTGVHPGLIAALRAFAPPESPVLLTTPVYSGFYSDIRITHTRADESEMRWVDGRYEIDWEDFERRARRCPAFILCNPQNPTGNLWTEDELLRMGEICLEHNCVVLADEIHRDFQQKGQTYVPFASLPNQEVVDNSLTFTAVSKTFSLAAMKSSWYFSTNEDLIERVEEYNRPDMNVLGWISTHAAVTEGDEWQDEVVRYLDANHDYVEQYINDRVPLVSYKKAEGTYLAWLDVSELQEEIGAHATAEEENATSVDEVTAEHVLQTWMVENAGVYLNPGSSYGLGGGGRMRMNLGTQRQWIEKALGNMETAVKRI